MRNALDKSGLKKFMRAIAASAPTRGHYRIYITGGGTAVEMGWRESTLDVDLSVDREDVLRDVQAIKEKLNINIELASPADFVPALPGSDDRHVHILTLQNVSFYHYDPYGQFLSKVVRGFEKDLRDADSLIRSGLVVPERMKSLLGRIPKEIYQKYPNLSPSAVERAVLKYLERYPTG
ncbi:MAG: hypothetical protein A3G34_12140 [Candidatus Lindowbacteria bacterium RIFCSPLOWO2_12_FULL_62_27]|nr:MAG: hypothetical protein A3G34_12140 [Candidatus Lindowbacteria bacterium RIFCSPLOWO2_12_FULL_62_27]OGH63550.1 MAG: hypothetical protein A3I06_05255 [Candidatus Lindowbacteria bacterium RIFCSPLOWO2_02_FULL_62_12]